MSNEMTRADVFAELAERGVHTARVEFAGGNDEGHAENIELLDAEDKAIEHSIKIYYGTDGAQNDIALSEALQQPIYDRWCGFDGDFSVWGNCIWRVPERRVELDYSESEYVPHTEVV
jgi:uncharacterized protein DUF6878